MIRKKNTGVSCSMCGKRRNVIKRGRRYLCRPCNMRYSNLMRRGLK